MVRRPGVFLARDAIRPRERESLGGGRMGFRMMSERNRLIILYDGVVEEEYAKPLYAPRRNGAGPSSNATTPTQSDGDGYGTWEIRTMHRLGVNAGLEMAIAIWVILLRSMYPQVQPSRLRLCLQHDNTRRSTISGDLNTTADAFSKCSA
jgi:hypothetical protein